MRRVEEENDEKMNGGGESSIKRLRHKIGHNVIMFSLQQSNVLRICVYDQTRPSQIYEEVFVGDCLPNEARNIFGSIAEMFDFLQMNFAALVSLREKEAIIVDLGKLKIPIKFQLPFRMNVYPIVDDLLQQFNSQHQKLVKQLEVANFIIEQNNQKHNQQLNILKKQLNTLKQQLNISKQSISSKDDTIRELKSSIEKRDYEIKQMKSKQQEQTIKLSQFQRENQILTRKIKQMADNTLTLNDLNKKEHTSSRRLDKNQQQPIIEMICNEKNEQHRIQIQIAQQPAKKPNPFLNGLFTRTIPSSSNSLLNNIKVINTPKKQQQQLLHKQSRFSRFTETQLNGQIKLNISKKMIKDSDIDQLIKHNFVNINRLILSENLITGKGLQTLFTINWPSLKSIVLSSNKITYFDLQKIHFQSIAPNLFLIDLNFNNLTREMFKKLVDYSKGNKLPKIYFNGVRSDSSCMLSISHYSIRK